jgi:hypothetical protein
MLRKLKLTTSRWRLPGSLRTERLVQLLARKDLKDILNSDFIKALESRKTLLESRRFKLLAWQAPIMIFLTFSLFHISANISIFGVSTEAANSLREMLLVLSSVLGLAFSALNTEVAYIDEMLGAVAIKYAGKDKELYEFLKVRYGIFNNVMPVASFNSELYIGMYQWTIAGVHILSGIMVIAATVGILLSVQILNLIEVYVRPTFSTSASVCVIGFVLLVDIVGFTAWLLRKSYQPYQTYEDLMRLERLRLKDKGLYQARISEIAQRHNRKGLLRRLFGRPTLRRLP